MVLSAIQPGDWHIQPCSLSAGLEVYSWWEEVTPQAALVLAWADLPGNENSCPLSQNTAMVHTLPHLPTEGFVKLFWAGTCWTAKTKGSFRTSYLLKCHGISWDNVKRQYTMQFPSAVQSQPLSRQLSNSKNPGKGTASALIPSPAGRKKKVL